MNDTDNVEFEQSQVVKADRKMRKARKREKRRALLTHGDLDKARRDAEKRLRRQARKQKEAFRSLSSAVYSLRD